MNIRSGFFNSINGDRRYEADFFADYFATFIGDGIFASPSDNFQVMANDDMTIRVRPGSAWIKGYVAFNDSNYKFALEAASGVLNRIDRVVLRLDVADRKIKLEVKQGEPAEVPDPAELERGDNAWELALADVYVGKGVISVTQADITDTRFDDKLCGIVKGVVDEIDTTDLFAQYDAEFSQWLKGLQDALDGDVAGNLMNLINEVRDDVDTRFHSIKELFGADPIIDLSEGKNFKHNVTEQTEYTIVPEDNKEMQSFNLQISQPENSKAIIFPSNISWDEGIIPDFIFLKRPFTLSFLSTNGGSIWFGRTTNAPYPELPTGFKWMTDRDLNINKHHAGSNYKLALPEVLSGEILSDATYLFKDSNVSSVILTHDFVEIMQFMFYGSIRPTIDLSRFCTSNVNSMRGMFRGSKIKTIDLTSFDTSNVKDMYMMFEGTSRLSEIDLSSFDMSNVIETGMMFGSSTVKTIYARTEADANKIKQSSNFPSGVNVIVK